MNAHYEDILSRIKEEPVWFDEHAVPRFCPFEPGRAADIYADEVVLAVIACQNCSREFRVAFSLNAFMAVTRQAKSIQEQIKTRTLHYGDPPNICCCASGPTMNSEMLRVEEYWMRDWQKFEWVRKPELEVEFDNDDE